METEQLKMKGIVTPELYPKTTATISIGTNLIWNLQGITFTKRQIKHMKKYFGWEVKNVEKDI